MQTKQSKGEGAGEVVHYINFRPYSHADLIAAATEIVPTATTTLFKVKGRWIASRQPILGIKGAQS